MFWFTITRLGEAQLLLPALLAVSLWLAFRSKAPRAALVWWGTTIVAAVITTATKLAFIGWGLGYAPLDFTGVSGHAMFAAAILPLLARESVSEGHARWHVPAVLIGVLAAGIVAISRVKTEAHSASEAWAGFLLGTLASGIALRLARLPGASAPKTLLVAMGLWLALGGMVAPTAPTHGWVTQIALKIAGRAQPYTRDDLHRDWRRRQAGMSAALPAGLQAAPQAAPQAVR